VTADDKPPVLAPMNRALPIQRLSNAPVTPQSEWPSHDAPFLERLAEMVRAGAEDARTDESVQPWYRRLVQR
jgi:hypothetical protein